MKRMTVKDHDLLAGFGDSTADARIHMSLILLDDIIAAATKWPRCCDLWQDSLGGMHCRDCSQKTFAMMRKIQALIGVDKECGKPPIPVAIPCACTDEQEVQA